ncbi:MAG TPA: hypothetical protein VMP01_07545 [Pirellulaceae bacterium]|nr:hypothetical protein [Pirellulaceae bacterium]
MTAATVGAFRIFHLLSRIDPGRFGWPLFSPQVASACAIGIDDFVQLPNEPEISAQRAGNLADEFSVLGRVPVIGKIVASEKVTGRQRAEQVAANYRASGLEVEIREPASEAAR